MSNHDIIGGLMVSFDIFEKKDIEKVEQKLNTVLRIQPKEEKSHITFLGGPDSYEVCQNVWKVDLSEVLKTLQVISDKKGFQLDNELLKTYIKYFEIRGYNSPRLPFYILMAKIVLNSDLLNSSDDLRKDIFLISQPIRLFIENLDGLTNKIVSYSSRASIVTQFWVKVDEHHLSQMRKTVLQQISQLKRNATSKDFEILDYPMESTDELLKFEPFNLAPNVGDVHSHIIDGKNIVLIIGHIMQSALGGLRTPYLIELSYEEDLLKSNLPTYIGPFSANLDWCNLDSIVWEGYGLLITLISISIYVSYIAFERVKIESELSKLRDVTSVTEYSDEELHNRLNELNNYGTQLSSLLNMLGTLSRQREKALQQISEGTSSLCFEVPIKTELHKFFPHQNEGYLRTIANQILNTLNSTKESLHNQESEIRSLQTHISNIVNLNNIRSNKALQTRMYALNRRSLIIVSISLIIAFASVFVGYQSWRVAELSYQKSHPEGTYYVQVDFLGYDATTNYDQFRISTNYQGRGESKYVKLSLGIVGANPIVASKGNLEVMEPNIILGRNYVNGLIGWVDYYIQRAGNITSKLNILDYASDVEVLVINNT